MMPLSSGAIDAQATLGLVALLVVCGLATGGLSMLLYARLSPQHRLAEVTARIAEARLALRQMDDADLQAVWSATQRALGLSLQQIRLILIPTAAAAVPVLVIATLIGMTVELSRLPIFPGLPPGWLWSGHLAYWGPLTAAAVVVKWKCGIK